MQKNMFEEAWNYSFEELKKEYKSQEKESEFIFNFNMNYVEDDGETITVSVASQFLQQMMIKKKSFEIILNKIKQVTNLESIKIKSVIKSDENSKDDNSKKSDSTEKSEKKEVKTEASENEKKSKAEESKTFKKHPLLQEDYRFETFIPGDNSNFAYNAALAVSKNPGKQYNPILLYGGSGLGKTHLMQAIGNYIYNNGGEKLKICYVSAESFTNEFIFSTKEGKTNAFKNKYRNLDILLLDDIHFLQNKDATQEELFYTFNALSEKNAQMVFTCDRPIKEIKNMTSRLVSRLANGLCIDLQPPNYETRVAILLKKIELLHKELDFKIVEYIAKNVETNVRELEASLNKVIGYMDLVGKIPTLEEVKVLLKDLLVSNISEKISLDTIQKVIADNYQISVSELKGKKREKKFVIPRQIAIYIARELTEISYSEIGEEFGGKDHSTIMHAYEKIAEQIKIDPSLESKVQAFVREIKEYKK